MESRESPPKGEPNPKPSSPKWSSPIWYLPVMILLLWFWQSTMTQFSYRTIPYSEFKAHLNQREVVKCVVRVDEIQGEIVASTLSNTYATKVVHTNQPHTQTTAD